VIRTLVLIAVTGFFLSVGCIAASFAIAGGPFAITDQGIVHARDFHLPAPRDRTVLGGQLVWNGDESARTSRDFTWSGGDRLVVDVPADLVLTQGPVVKLTISGPKEILDKLIVGAGAIRTDSGEDLNDDYRLKIIMTAPGIQKFELNGDQNMVIEGYNQPMLGLDITGSGGASVKGVAQSVQLSVAGSGRADLADLVIGDAVVDISGSGHAKLGPKGAVKVDISGSGDVELTAKPKSLSSDISGSGHVSQPGLPG
jgi:Putative auto-transporter adhesin, head GIN domain